MVGTEGIEDFNPARETVNVRLFLPDLFPIGEPEATTTTSATGSFVFEGLDAPTTYLVAVYRAADSGEPISSQIVSTEPSVDRNDLKFSVALR